MNILGLEHAPHRGEGIENSFPWGKISDAYLTMKPVYEKDIVLPDIELVDAIILSGGPMGVYELNDPKYEYIRREMIYLEEAIRRGKPILGICFGHQLLAHIFGAKVLRMEEKKEIGWYDVQIKDSENPVFKGIKKSLKVFEFHNDQIVFPPSNSEVLACTDLCPIEALSYTDCPVFSVQFHPEIDEVAGTRILENYAKNVPYITPVSDINNRKEIFNNFVCIAKEQCSDND